MKSSVATVLGSTLASMVMVTSLLVPGDARAGCDTNPNTGVVVCGAGDCAIDATTGVVWCSRFRGGGAAVNRNNGGVICGVGGCAVNRNDGAVYCSPYPGGSAATNANSGAVVCTSDTGQSVECVAGRGESCEMAQAPE